MENRSAPRVDGDGVGARDETDDGDSDGTVDGMIDSDGTVDSVGLTDDERIPWRFRNTGADELDEDGLETGK